MSAEKVDPLEYKGLWVFVEQKEGEAVRVSLELLGKGRSLADRLGVGVTAILIGNGVSDQAEELIYAGADEVIVADDPIAEAYRTEVYTHIMVREVRKRRPEILLIGGTCVGRDLAPRVAGRLNTGCTSDCTELEIDRESRLLVATKPFLGRNLMAEIVCPEIRPQIVTLRPGIMELLEKDRGRKGDLIYVDVGLREEDVTVKVIDRVRSASEGVSLDEADKIVAGGMGVGDEAGFETVKELAELLGAEMGATSLPVDEGWISQDRKIGQTGKSVRPRLYIACGISGAVQHTVGMVNSELIVAINKDPKAEIFDVADYGIVDDLHKVVPAIIDELRKMRP